MNKDIAELLSFYVNGTLDEKDIALVERAIKDDPSVRDEVVFLQRLRREMQTQKIENSPGDLGLKRLQRSLKEEQIKNDPVARAKSKITKEQNWQWRVAAIAACFLLFLQTAMTFNMPRGDDLNAAGGVFDVRVAERIINVTFSPDAREESIRQLLLSMDINIIDGPTALGVYKLSVAKDAEAVIEKLRAQSNLIESVGLEGPAQ